MEKYEFISELADGAFGKVYKAHLRQDPTKLVGIKKINKKLAITKSQLVNEIKIIKTLDHPNIIRFYEVYNDE